MVGQRLAVFILAAASAAALGDPLVVRFVQRNPNLDPNSDYYIYGTRVTIFHGYADQQFQFECYYVDPNGNYSHPADISSIAVDPNAGPVRLTVLPDPNDPNRLWGASDVLAMNLANSGVTCRVEGFNIVSALGDPNDPNAVQIDEIAGDFHAGYIANDVVIAKLTSGCFSAFNVYANLTLTDTTSPHAGSIDFSGSCPSTITIGGSMTGDVLLAHGCYQVFSGTLSVGQDAHNITIGSTCSGDMLGRVLIGRDLLGGLVCHQSVAQVDPNQPDPEPVIVIGRNLVGTVNLMSDLHRALEIHGGVTREERGTAIDVFGSLTSQVRVNGVLVDGPSNYEIDIGNMSSTAAIAIDWDGYQPGDDWQAGALIRVGQTAYWGNDPNARVYEITCPKGDLNNSADPRDPNTWNPDFDDINPFVVALSGQAEYEAAFPGLGGSWQYHADCNCDSNVDFDDIDAFVLRLTDADGYYVAYPGCELCEGQDNLGQSLPNDPASIARLFRTYVAPERLPGFIAHAREFVRHHAGTPRGQYWAAVLRHLE